ncbi:LptF/LptG family permease [Alteraurantiacibacter aquimixticola]|uniref:LptF/LptG family permease n=1 Tax=Alteraurantiacibacter aquimixticola TaxID=2489173 RepID=A0A4T3F3T6_9SPHN|nr:LptF/LptG family permease [Alteraurantiacibacter aquimixticola]TIX51109.1 LptF/LptG family permease [Alteraurantiacibacter aquimixticola]
MLLARIDRYVLGSSLGTLGSVIGIIMSLMVLEHIPRLIEITRLSGQRGYIVWQTVLGLLPEYAGIGMLVGLYLAIALSVRKLAMRGELAVIEATGIGPRRWMRMPVLLSVLVAAFVLANQGWMQPEGERRIDEIGQRMANGDFGINLAPRRFHDLGDGMMVYFDSVDPDSATLGGLMIVDDERTYNASSGKLGFAPDGRSFVRLIDGQSIGKADGTVLSFAMLAFESRPEGIRMESGHAEDNPLRSRSLDELLRSPDPDHRAAAFARMLWVVLVLLTPLLAFALGRPPMRSSSPIGFALGLCLLVAFIKSLSLIETRIWLTPMADALALGMCWTALVMALILWQNRSGFGAVDRAILSGFKRIRRGIVLARPPAAARHSCA